MSNLDAILWLVKLTLRVAVTAKQRITFHIPTKGASLCCLSQRELQHWLHPPFLGPPDNVHLGFKQMRFVLHIHATIVPLSSSLPGLLCFAAKLGSYTLLRGGHFPFPLHFASVQRTTPLSSCKRRGNRPRFPSFEHKRTAICN